MPSSYELRGHSINEEPEKEPPVGPYKNYKEAFNAGLFELAKKDGVWILMDPPENSRHTAPIKLKIVTYSHGVKLWE